MEPPFFPKCPLAQCSVVVVKAVKTRNKFIPAGNFSYEIIYGSSVYTAARKSHIPKSVVRARSENITNQGERGRGFSKIFSTQATPNFQTFQKLSDLSYRSLFEKKEKKPSFTWLLRSLASLYY